MEIGAWISDNFFNLLTGTVAILSLWFTAFALRSETKTRKVANLLTITANHWAIWKEFVNNPNLWRVREVVVDMVKQPITPGEWQFVIEVVLHSNSAFYTLADQLIVKYDGLRQDIEHFFSLPIPREVWKNIKRFQNDDFIRFIDSVLK